MGTESSPEKNPTNPTKVKCNKKVIVVALALALLIAVGVLLPTVIIPKVKSMPQNVFMFKKLSDGTYMIIGVKGSPSSVVIPETYRGKPVKQIDWGAFHGCTSITSIEIPDTPLTIPYLAFYDCVSLVKAKIPAEAISYIPKGKLTTLEITSGYVEYKAFEGCTSLKSVVIYDEVSWLSDYAFTGCTGLTSVTIGNGVRFIGEKAFFGCTSLTTLKIGNGVTDIDRFAFSVCSNLTSVVIPDSVTRVGYSAFSGCFNLTIYCEATSQPATWDSYWNPNCPAYWYSETQPTSTGNYWHYVNGVVTKW